MSFKPQNKCFQVLISGCGDVIIMVFKVMVVMINLKFIC